MALSFKGGYFRDASGQFVTTVRGRRSSIARKQERAFKRKRKKKKKKKRSRRAPDQPIFEGLISAPMFGPDAFPTGSADFELPDQDIFDGADDLDQEDDYDADPN